MISFEHRKKSIFVFKLFNFLTFMLTLICVLLFEWFVKLSILVSSHCAHTLLRILTMCYLWVEILQNI
jgi:hypothetical protein